MSDTAANHNARPRSRRAIESDIEQTRSRLDQTLTDLEHQLEPRQLINDTFDYVRRGGANDFAVNLGDTIKDNPVPFVLTTVGIGWLMLAQRSSQQRQLADDSDYTGTNRRGKMGDMSARARDTAERAKDKVANMAGSARQSAHDMKDAARDRKDATAAGAQNLSSRAQGGAQQLSSRTRDTAQQLSGRAQNAGNQTVRFIEDNPLAAGAIGVAIGAALGGLIPVSRTENRQLGGLRDEVFDKASQAGLEQAEKVRADVDERARKTQKNTSESSEHSGGSRTEPNAGTPSSASTRGAESGATPTRTAGDSTASTPRL